jgi:Chaperone of endosialidase
VDASGHLGTTTSSARFKEAINPMDKASEAILTLKPVTFRYKEEQGKPYTVRYEAVNAMLLNEFLKARRQIDVQEKQIAALTAGLQKVSAQLELSKAAPQTVLNDQ